MDKSGAEGSVRQSSVPAMRLLSSLLALLSLALAANVDPSTKLNTLMKAHKALVLEAKKLWPTYKKQFGKSYTTSGDAMKHVDFVRNYVAVELHNAAFEKGESSYELGLNQFSDMSDAEYQSFAGGVIDAPVDVNNLTEAVTHGRTKRAPVNVDWRASRVTTVKNQGTCGSCYAFSAAAVIESRLRTAYGTVYDLSEQQLLDCTYYRYANNMNLGCSGGDPQTTLQHALYYGIQQEYYYRYAGRLQNCAALNGQIALSNYKLYYVQNNEVAMRDGVATYGPIAVTINASPSSFMNYKGGIYNDPACGAATNHAVLLVGYGTTNGVNYWIVKNSWGTTWGNNGYMLLVRGYNRCGIVSKYGYFIQ